MKEQDDADDVRIDTRLSGQVRRYHTWPIIGEQTISEHCWQILRIYLSVTETIDPHMVMHIAFHDIGETYSGDPPYPLKSQNPELKTRLDYIEKSSMLLQLQYWGAFRQVMLSEEDLKFFKQIELVEMAELGMDQLCLGNSHGFPIANRCLRSVYQNQPCARLVLYVIRRLTLFAKQCKTDLNVSFGDWWFTEKWESMLKFEEKVEEGHGSK